MLINPEERVLITYVVCIHFNFHQEILCCAKGVDPQLDTPRGTFDPYAHYLVAASHLMPTLLRPSQRYILPRSHLQRWRAHSYEII